MTSVKLPDPSRSQPFHMKTGTLGDEGMAQLIQCLPVTRRALRSSPQQHTNWWLVVVHTCNPSTWRVEVEFHSLRLAWAT